MQLPRQTLAETARAAYNAGMSRPELLREIPPVERAGAVGRGPPGRPEGPPPRAGGCGPRSGRGGAAGRAERRLPDTDTDAFRELIFADVQSRIAAALGPFYRRVVNTTGIILHTGLGRAVLPPRAVDQIARELAGYSLLQTDLETGGRSRRDGRIEELLQRLTGAEAATVVNNNAAATAIVLNSVAAGREVIVSRGQLVEIGGSFRLPDVMTAAGVRLVEVGTTNKTRLSDYQQAIGPDTAAILRVHPSNYKIEGFTAEVPLMDLVRLGRDRRLTVIDDVGAGGLVDVSRFGFQKEPTLPESVAAGADLVTCSADKLIGGPQGGIILGKAAWIQAIRQNPLARIVRVNKLSLAALEATLTLFLDEATALAEVPTLRMLCRGLAELDAQARRIAAAILAAPGVEAAVLGGVSQMGSGSLPAQNLPTRVVAVASRRLDAGQIAHRLRHYATPVFARVHDGRVLVDPRTLLDGDEEILIAAFRGAGNGGIRDWGLGIRASGVGWVERSEAPPRRLTIRWGSLRSTHPTSNPQSPIPNPHSLPMLNITLGTAGHIDHGKTALVKSLTGCETDRLKEEKLRGMSIDLGYAPCRIADLEVGMVDVPGHENFIKTMVAGASGMDGVILVVAADNGIMPQTREHLDILTLLGLRHGLVALTKVNRVDASRVQQVQADLNAYLRGTFLESAPVLPLSNVTGQGFDPFSRRC